MIDIKIRGKKGKSRFCRVFVDLSFYCAFFVCCDLSTDLVVLLLRLNCMSL